MEVNGDSLEVEGMRTVQGETIPPVQAEFVGDGSGEPVFLQAEEEITVHRSVQAIRGDLTPIAEEQAQLRQDVQDLASEAANVLYNTAVRSEQSVAGLRQETGHALSQAESAIWTGGLQCTVTGCPSTTNITGATVSVGESSAGRAEDGILDERAAGIQENPGGNLSCLGGTEELHLLNRR